MKRDTWGFIAYVVWNVIVCLIYGLDKRFKKKHKRRIREEVLIFLAFAMGGFGAFFGMQIFNNKTKYMKFKVCSIMAIILNIWIIFILMKKPTVIKV